MSPENERKETRSVFSLFLPHSSKEKTHPYSPDISKEKQHIVCHALFFGNERRQNAVI